MELVAPQQDRYPVFDDYVICAMHELGYPDAPYHEEYCDLAVGGAA